MLELGLHLHVNPITREPAVWEYCGYLSKKYDNFHVYLKGGMKDIMERLSQCDFGLLPEPLKIEQGFLDIMLPNKLFDYLACGLPVASINGIVINNYLKEQQAGFTFENSMDLYDKLDEFSITSIEGSHFCIEHHFPRVEKFCRGVINGS